MIDSVGGVADRFAVWLFDFVGFAGYLVVLTAFCVVFVVIMLVGFCVIILRSFMLFGDCMLVLLWCSVHLRLDRPFCALAPLCFLLCSGHF